MQLFQRDLSAEELHILEEPLDLALLTQTPQKDPNLLPVHLFVLLLCDLDNLIDVLLVGATADDLVVGKESGILINHIVLLVRTLNKGKRLLYYLLLLVPKGLSGHLIAALEDRRMGRGTPLKVEDSHRVVRDLPIATNGPRRTCHDNSSCVDHNMPAQVLLPKDSLSTHLMKVSPYDKGSVVVTACSKDALVAEYYLELLLFLLAPLTVGTVPIGNLKQKDLKLARIVVPVGPVTSDLVRAQLAMEADLDSLLVTLYKVNLALLL